MITQDQTGTAKEESLRVIMHIDLDYFYAQCEEIRKPEIKNNPVVVCIYSGRKEDTGVVSTSNYIARNHGIKSAMPIRMAKSKLLNVPTAIFLEADIGYYSEKSAAAMSVIKRFAEKFEYVGLDECFIDITQTSKSNFTEAKKFAELLKNNIREETGLTCSIGVASNKLLAKIASDLQKPDGLTIVRPENAIKFISKYDVIKIPGIGPKTRKRLTEMGINSIEELSKMNLFKMMEEFGKRTAIYLYNASKGIDHEPLQSQQVRKQIGRIITLRHDISESYEVYHELEKLCKCVYQLTQNNNLSFKNIGILFVQANLHNISRSKTLKSYSRDYNELYITAKLILNEALNKGDSNCNQIKIRRLGVRVSDLKDNSGQNNIFDFIKNNR
jgi:DNA polymerase IV (archaeal DinB-like DNA polymerase)